MRSLVLGAVDTPEADQALVDMAVELATAAGALTRKWFDRGTVQFDTKDDGSPVTEADKAAERYLREQISLAFPTDAIVGEEEDDRDGTSGRTWIIDPIDGTKSFTHGVPLYGTLLSVVDEHGPSVGVIVMPALDEVLSAGRGLGARHNGRETSVNDNSDFESSYIMTSGLEYWPDPAERDRLVNCDATLRTWADAYGYLLLATGRCEAVIDPLVKIWDIAPMQVIIPEAGGVLTDQIGAPWEEGRHIVASNGKIHNRVIEAVFGNGAEPNIEIDADELDNESAGDAESETEAE